MDDRPSKEGPKLNPELERRAKLPSIAEVKAWLDKKEVPSTKQRILEGVTRAVVAGIIIWLMKP